MSDFFDKAAIAREMKMERIRVNQEHEQKIRAYLSNPQDFRELTYIRDTLIQMKFALTHDYIVAELFKRLEFNVEPTFSAVPEWKITLD